MSNTKALILIGLIFCFSHFPLTGNAQNPPETAAKPQEFPTFMFRGFSIDVAATGFVNIGFKSKFGIVFHLI